jgi:hypothetical protein
MTSEMAGGEGGPRIRTPDQRVRVFVSSTLSELAAERAAARTAITRLHLTPIMFELGARPHAPRELYRAYLAQSEVFVGIYWQQYGWVAPGEEVSGLEDEYLLSGDKPKLMSATIPTLAASPSGTPPSAGTWTLGPPEVCAGSWPGPLKRKILNSKSFW